jgi:energy-coupling factor transport system ATP-binding protein
MTPIIETQELTHIYSRGTPFEHTALADVDFHADEGEFVGLIGHTGSGKSTLIQHLNGLLKPTEGKVLFRGQNIWSDPKTTRATRFKVGMVFQYPEYQLFEETVFEDIAFGPKNMGLSSDEIDRRVRRAAEFADLREEDLARSPFELSGGQKRRVAIAGVIAMEPDVLVLDEPTAGLDPAGRENILCNIEEFHKANNTTIVLVSHSMEDIARMADRLVVMRESRIAMTGTPHGVFARAEELTAMGLTVPQATLVFRRLYAAGLPIDPAVYTLGQAKAALLALKGGRRHA